MGLARSPDSVLLFAALMYSEQCLHDSALQSLEQRFGPVWLRVGPLPFDYSDYYSREMGEGLSKTYYVFEQLIQREQLSAIKNVSNELEQQLGVEGKRRVNIDPGYMSRDKLVLASTKDYFHRIYLGEGIFGEVTLHCRGGRFRYFSWTYQDYRDEQVQAMLLKGRAFLVGQQRKMNA